MSQPAPIVVKMKPRSTSYPIVILSLLVTLFALQFAQYGTDWGAYGIALTTDCSVITMIFIGFPVLTILDAAVAMMRVPKWLRLGVYLIPALIAFTSNSRGRTFEEVIGTPQSNIALLSERSFTTFAGGGEKYGYVQFRIEPDAFAELMTRAGFQFVADDTSGMTVTIDLAQRFRCPVVGVTHWREYSRSWPRINDGSRVLYDVDRHVAHAKRTQG